MEYFKLVQPHYKCLLLQQLIKARRSYKFGDVPVRACIVRCLPVRTRELACFWAWNIDVSFETACCAETHIVFPFDIRNRCSNLKVKSGKYFQNVSIDGFFLKICTSEISSSTENQTNNTEMLNNCHQSGLWFEQNDSSETWASVKPSKTLIVQTQYHGVQRIS